MTRTAGRTGREIQDIALADGRHLRVDGTYNLRDVGGYPTHAGQDRTGIVIALVLAVLGVPDELIGADYSLSLVYLDPDGTAVIGRLKATGPGDNVTAELLSSPAGLMLLERVRVSSGLTQEELARPRAGLRRCLCPRASVRQGRPARTGSPDRRGLRCKGARRHDCHTGSIHG